MIALHLLHFQSFVFFHFFLHFIDLFLHPYHLQYFSALIKIQNCYFNEFEDLFAIIIYLFLPQFIIPNFLSSKSYDLPFNFPNFFILEIIILKLLNFLIVKEFLIIKMKFHLIKTASLLQFRLTCTLSILIHNNLTKNCLH